MNFAFLLPLLWYGLPWHGCHLARKRAWYMYEIELPIVVTLQMCCQMKTRWRKPDKRWATGYGHRPGKSWGFNVAFANGFGACQWWNIFLVELMGVFQMRLKGYNLNYTHLKCWWVYFKYDWPLPLFFSFMVQRRWRAPLWHQANTAVLHVGGVGGVFTHESYPKMKWLLDKHCQICGWRKSINLTSTAVQMTQYHEFKYLNNL